MGSIGARFGAAMACVLAMSVGAHAQDQQAHWDGLYVGAHAGIGRSSARSTYTGSADVMTLIAGGALPANYDVGASEFIGGVQLGYNFRFGSLILGVEGDLSAGSFTKTSSVRLVNPDGTYVYAPGNQWDSQGSFKLDSISSVRGRLGATAGDGLMFFATAGIAFADAKSSGHIAQTYPVGGTNYRNWTGGASENVSGFVFGAGAEYAYSKHWLIRLEALRYDFGTLQDILLPQSGNAPGGELAPVARATNLDLAVVRAGLSYNF